MGRVKNSDQHHLNVKELQMKLELLRLEVARQIAISELNNCFSYSRTLLDKVNSSFALNSFVRIQGELLNSAIIGVCRIWDPKDTNRCSIPTVIYYTSKPEFRKSFEEFALRNFVNLHAIKTMGVRWAELDLIKNYAEEIVHGVKLRALKKYRDKHLAHLLDAHRDGVDPQSNAQTALRYGYEQDLLSAAIETVTRLSRVLTDGHFNFEGYIDNYRSEANLFSCSVEFTSRKDFNTSR